MANPPTESATSFRERLAYTLFQSAVAAGLESDKLDYLLQIDYYLRFADELLDRMFKLGASPNADRFDLPLSASRDPHPNRG